MTQVSIITSSTQLNVQDNHITVGEFALYFIIVDIGLIVIGIILWRFSWYNLNSLTIWDIRAGRDRIIGKDTQISVYLGCLHRIIKNLSSIDKNYIMHQCGFEAFAYLFFLRRLTHLMLVLAITDLFVWIPYQLYLNSWQSFSLVTVDSSKNGLFRVFYMIWVTLAVFYSLRSMKRYLRLLLRNYLFRGQKRLLNNLKSKTVFIRFVGQNRRIDTLQMRTRLVQQLKVQDTVLGCLQIKNTSKLISLQYQYLIYRMVQELGPDHFTKLWHFFKNNNKRKDELQAKIRAIHQQKSQQADYTHNTYLVAFQNYETAQNLVRQFENSRSLMNLLQHSPSQLSGLQIMPLQMWVGWAHSPQDILWVNVGLSETSVTVKGILMNILVALLIIAGVSFIVLARTKSIISIPNVIVPWILTVINFSLRWLVSKSSQWQNRYSQSQWHMKQMKVLVIFFCFTALVASLVRDTLNLLDVFTNTWAWTQILRLVYKKPDGFFYYIYILNQIAFTFFSCLFRMDHLFPEVFQVHYTHQKNKRIRNKSKYATNAPFRYGFSYALNVIVFAMVLMYSASTPLIHLCGFLYFFAQLYLYGYTFAVFHKQQQTVSNLRLLQTVCDYLFYFTLGVMFLIGISMLFQEQYVYGLIIYLWLGLLVILSIPDFNIRGFLHDHITDQELRGSDLPGLVAQWRYQYEKSMELVNIRLPL